MKKRSKRIIIGVIGFLLLTVLAFAIYFYMAFSGNIIERFSQQRAIIKVYETRYDEDFKIVSSSYGYKRKEFSFRLSSKSKPEIIFTSTLDEADRIDRYAAARSIDYLRKVVSEAFGKDFDDLQYRVNIFEEYNSPDLLERDVTTRLSQNQYVVDLSWDPSVLDTLQIDTIFKDMTQRISGRLDTSIGGLKIRAGVYDGKDYYITEVDLR
ncbi:MAG: hypothetical protein EOL98_09965 [Negativicutes bacterium]|nr:hypothetical protein [Negativicutes bacterium]